MRTPKFNFVPEHQIESGEKKPFLFASITSFGQFAFGKDYIEIYELKDQFIQFYVDSQKRTIGWKIIKGDTTPEILSNCRQCVLNEKGRVVFTLSKLLTQIGWVSGIPHKKMPIKFYTQDKSTEIHYIELPDIVASVTLNGVEQNSHVETN